MGTAIELTGRILPRGDNKTNCEDVVLTRYEMLYQKRILLHQHGPIRYRVCWFPYRRKVEPSGPATMATFFPATRAATASARAARVSGSVEKVDKMFRTFGLALRGGDGALEA